ncbi:MAG TPA: glycosyltransferase, partial [Arenibaculum sp.]|nr:glycosyltransferase [Arenibaculum sp.]
EAMACGTPCVSTAVGDAPVIIGDTGLIVPPRDPARLAAALGEMCGMGAEERRRLGTAARARIVANYALPIIVERYEALYAELAGGN